MKIVISMDTTASMSPVIREVRHNIKQLVSELVYEIPDLRIQLIAHGDYCDYPKDFFLSPETNNGEELAGWIDETPNTYGGDSDEFYELVLNSARELFVPNEKNIFVMVGDANPHPVNYRLPDFTYRQSGSFDWNREAYELSKNAQIISVHCRNTSSWFWKELGKFGHYLTLGQFSDMTQLIYSIAYKQIGNDRLEQYKDYLESEFKLNRSLADAIGTLVGRNVNVKHKTKTGLIPVSPTRFQMVRVHRETAIKPFVESMGIDYKKGRGFYEFTKKETIQENKEVVLRERRTGEFFTGPDARKLIGLPYGERGDIKPIYLADYDIFVQSTSVNRKLMPNTRFLYEDL